AAGQPDRGPVRVRRLLQGRPDGLRQRPGPRARAPRRPAQLVRPGWQRRHLRAVVERRRVPARPGPVRGATGRAAAAFGAAAALVAAASCSQQRAHRAASASSVRTTSTSSPTSSTTTAPASTTATTVGASVSASSPVSTAHGIASAEDTIRRADASPDELRRAGEEQQIKYRLLVIHPEWIDQVLANLPDRLRPIVRANAHASTELRLLTKPHPALPQWRIVAPAPAEELL